jgi:hypothetical protein
MSTSLPTGPRRVAGRRRGRHPSTAPRPARRPARLGVCRAPLLATAQRSLRRRDRSARECLSLWRFRLERGCRRTRRGSGQWSLSVATRAGRSGGGRSRAGSARCAVISLGAQKLATCGRTRRMTVGTGASARQPGRRGDGAMDPRRLTQRPLTGAKRARTARATTKGVAKCTEPGTCVQPRSCSGTARTGDRA